MNGNNGSTATKASNKKKTGKFNIIDFLLIVLALLIVAAIIYVFLPDSWLRNAIADETVEIQYTIELQGVDEAFLDKISENDIVLDSVTKSNIGTVTAIDYSTQYSELKYNQQLGEGVLSIVPEKRNVIVTISATAKFTEGKGYTVDGTRIAVGEKIYVRFPNYVCEGYCISVPLNER